MFYARGVVNLRTWMRQDLLKWADGGASCSRHPYLPWTDEATPSRSMQDAMAAICADCPVATLCAAYAINTRVAGGFYAGVWLPWNIDARRARRALRQAAKQH